jgi:hypothetical protein
MRLFRPCCGRGTWANTSWVGCWECRWWCWSSCTCFFTTNIPTHPSIYSRRLHCSCTSAVWRLNAAPHIRTTRGVPFRQHPGRRSVAAIESAHFFEFLLAAHHALSRVNNTTFASLRAVPYRPGVGVSLTFHPHTIPEARHHEYRRINIHPRSFTQLERPHRECRTPCGRGAL